MRAKTHAYKNTHAIKKPRMCVYGWQGQQMVCLSSKQESVIMGPEGNVKMLAS